jgi:tRNA threonylcarbamoyl adenosine modification protein YeaZ
MKLVLALDGALGPFSVALLAADGSVARALAADGNDALERGLALVGEVLGSTPLEAVDAIAVSTGPGSYTGLRIALSYAKALAFARKLPLVALSSYDVLEPPDPEGPVAAFVSGRPGRVCARLRLGNALEVRCGAEADVADALAGLLPRGATLTCAGAWKGAAPRLGERDIILQPWPSPDSPPALSVARRALCRGTPGSPHAAGADYGER